MTFHALVRKLSAPEKQEREKHATLPWITSPFQGVDLQNIAFFQRHVASIVELFFDLFFVANLGTFTAIHSITSGESLLSYIGFFTILWSTWFQITLFDVRFVSDSVLERVCKVIQLVVFVVFAFAASRYDVQLNVGDPLFFRTMSAGLAISRLLLALQYTVVLLYSFQVKAQKVYLPVSLCILVFTIAWITFSILTVQLRAGSQATVSRLTSITNSFYGVIAFEAIGIIGIAMIWRTLSFKKTHIVERLGLLTLIVIGEGALGVTETVYKMMGRSGLQVDGCALIFCIIMIIASIWVLYFDNQPEWHYGTIRQQIYTLLHFPLHLSIVGIVEGSQHVALARYVSSSIAYFMYEVKDACLKQHLESDKLAHALESSLSRFQLQGDQGWNAIAKTLAVLRTEAPDVCSVQNLHDAEGPLGKGWPNVIGSLVFQVLGTLFQSMGMHELPKGVPPFAIAFQSYEVVYDYLFAGVAIVLVCLAILLGLTRKRKHDSFDVGSLVVRLVTAMIAISLCVAGSMNEQFKGEYLSSVMMLPTVVLLLGIVVGTDRVMRSVANGRLKQRELPVEDGEEVAERQETDEQDGIITIVLASSIQN